MRAPPVWLILLLCLVVVAGCQQGSVSPPPALAPFFPTVTPTPPPTPTREGEIVIPFDTIAAGSLLQAPAVDDGPENTTVFGPKTVDEIEDLVGKSPFVFIATSPDETTSFEQWLQPETSSEIAKLDFEKYVVIAFFKGLSGPCCDGYIARIASDEAGKLTVYATLRSRSSGPEVLSFPGHIVRIQRTDVPFPVTQDVQLHLVTNQVWVP